MLDDSIYSTSHGAVGVQMAVNLETNLPIFLNQQLKINLSNNWKFVVNNVQVHLYYIIMFIFYVDLIVFVVLNFMFQFIN
jgi:hypothetical protein